MEQRLGPALTTPFYISTGATAKPGWFCQATIPLGRVGGEVCKARGSWGWDSHSGLAGGDQGSPLLGNGARFSSHLLPHYTENVYIPYTSLAHGRLTTRQA